MNMISKTDYSNYLNKKFEADYDKFCKEREDIKKEIIMAVKNDDEDRLGRMLAKYAYASEHDRPTEPRYDKKWPAVYDECEKVARVCNLNFETEWVDNQTVLVSGPFKTLSSACKIIAALAELHSGMFSFESSFSEHEAYTKSGHRLTIGVYDNRVRIKLNLTK